MTFKLGGRHLAALMAAAVLAATTAVVVSSSVADVRAGAAGDRREDTHETTVPFGRPNRAVAVPASTAPAGTAAPVAAVAAARPSCPWVNPRLPVATRVNLLLAAMSPLQEATLLHLRQYKPTVGYEGYTPAQPALCIPMITEQDGAAGVATGMTGVTQLPSPIADAAAFDPSLAQRYGDVIGSEDATKGVDLALSPTINIDRSPLWGRSYESLGEDPFLTASLAVPLVQGIQANRVVSVVKHFAVYNQESHRATAADNSIVSDQALHEVYLPAFAAVTRQAHAGAMMCSYNLINGVPACENGPLINGILRHQWGFQGMVRSDCGSVYDQASAMAVGISQVKCTRLYDPATMAAAVAAGRMPRATLDGLARPLLSVLFQYDLVANPHPPDRAEVATGPAHQQVAAQTANEGTVLLKNDANLLPLDFTHLGSVALIGPQDGTPMPAGFGAMHVLPTHPVSALAALRAALGSRVLYDPGTNPSDAVAVARRAQVAIVVVHDVESEHYDRSSLSLPGNQDALVSAVANANRHTIVVLETGAAVLMPWIRSVSAILETWYPGEAAGTSLVDILSGRVNPSGKLPVTFPASAAQMPDNTPATFGGAGGRTLYSDGVNVGYRWYEATGVKPAFSFGYGLSYTRFAFSGLQSKVVGGGISVTARITNQGSLRGADVVQCYVGAPSGTGEPARQLRAYQRVDLLPGQSQVVTMRLSPGDLAVWSTAQQQWIVPAGPYRLYVGDGSDIGNLPLTTSVNMAPAALGVASGPAA